MSETNKDNMMYLVQLQGGGDEMITLVKPCVWEWIVSDYQGTEGGYEAVPEEVVAEFKAHDKMSWLKDGAIHVGSRSFDNDRAIAAPGLDFETMKEAQKYAKTNNIEIEDYYEGYLY
jgi:hypothetical protein